MTAGWIPKESFDVFRPLLLPTITAAAEAGQPLTLLGLTDGPVACGAAAGWLERDTFSIYSFYVAPDYRRRGGGRQLMETIRDLTKDVCQDLSFSYTALSPDHDTLPPFLTAMGFTEEIERNAFCGIRLEDLAKNEFFSSHHKAPGSAVQTFEQISPALLDRAYRAAAARGEAYIAGSLTGPAVDKTVSVALGSKTEPQSFAAVERLRPDLVLLSWLQCARSQDVLPLLTALCGLLLEHYPPETLLVIQTINGAALALREKLLPEAIQLSHSWSCPL